MADAVEPVLTVTTPVFYKAKNGEIKELHIVQPLDPAKRKMELSDIQVLAKEISKVLREDAL